MQWGNRGTSKKHAVSIASLLTCCMVLIACAPDEGLANVDDEYSVFYGERTPWWVIVEAVGPTGHGSRFIQGTATHALHAFTSRALKFRKEQE